MKKVRRFLRQRALRISLANANEVTVLARMTLAKTGFTPATGDITCSLDAADPDGINSTQDLTADTITALNLDSVGLPCVKILVKLITPVSGTNVELSLQSGGSFDANRFAVLTKQYDVALWTPKLGSTIYVKAIGAAARIATFAG